jgi:hypothetical protein
MIKVAFCEIMRSEGHALHTGVNDICTVFYIFDPTWIMFGVGRAQKFNYVIVSFVNLCSESHLLHMDIN